MACAPIDFGHLVVGPNVGMRLSPPIGNRFDLASCGGTYCRVGSAGVLENNTQTRNAIHHPADSGRQAACERCRTSAHSAGATNSTARLRRAAAGLFPKPARIALPGVMKVCVFAWWMLARKQRIASRSALSRARLSETQRRHYAKESRTRHRAALRLLSIRYGWRSQGLPFGRPGLGLESAGLTLFDAASSCWQPTTTLFAPWLSTMSSRLEQTTRSLVVVGFR